MTRKFEGFGPFGIPIVSDTACPPDRVYLLSKDYFHIDDHLRMLIEQEKAHPDRNRRRRINYRLNHARARSKTVAER